MTKQKAIELQEKYGMEILRHDITREAFGLRLVRADAVPELEALCAECQDPDWRSNYYIEDFYHGEGFDHDYRLYLPTDWFDLGGWVR